MKIRLIAFLTATVLAAGLAQAQAPAAAGPTAAGPAARQQLRAKRAAMLRGRASKALNLSDTQKQQAKTIREQARQTAQPVRDQLQQNRQALTAAVKTGNAAQIQALSKTQGDLMGQAMAIRSQAQAQVYAGLTNDQRQKMDAIQARIQQRIAQRQANRGLAN